MQLRVHIMKNTRFGCEEMKGGTVKTISSDDEKRLDFPKPPELRLADN